MLTLADKGGGGVWTSLFLADIICEQLLTDRGYSYSFFRAIVSPAKHSKEYSDTNI